MPTGIPWLDVIVEEAGVPAALDLEGAAMAHSEMTGIVVTPTTYRRKPVPYTILGRSRRYNVRDVVAYAKRCVEEAPVRNPAPRRGKPTFGTTLNT
jgi:hypothetical protein